MSTIPRNEVLNVVTAISVRDPQLAAKMLDAYEDSHPGGVGMTIVQKIESALDAAFLSWMKMGRPQFSNYRADASVGVNKTVEETELAEADGFVRGMIAALAILKSSNPFDEREAALDRYQNRIVLGTDAVEEANGANEQTKSA